MSGMEQRIPNRLKPSTASLLNQGTALALWFSVIPVFAAGNVYHDRFEWRPDLDGPGIEVIPPSDWVQSREVEITLRDPSGLATRGAETRRPNEPAYRDINSGVDLTAFFGPTTEETFSYWVRDINGVLGGGTDLIVVAQDVFGNFSQKIFRLVADSPIRTGVYVLDAPFESDPMTAQHCTPVISDYDPETVVFRAESISVGVPPYFTGGLECHGEGLCLEFYGGGLSAVSNWSDEPEVFYSGQAGVTVASLQTNVIETPINAGYWTGPSSFGTKLDAVFSEEDPNTLDVELTLYCFVEDSGGQAAGCPIPRYQNCHVDTFGPFQLRGALQVN